MKNTLEEIENGMLSGITEIDDQNKELIKFLKELNKCIKRKTCDETYLISNKIIEEFKKKFATEDEYYKTHMLGGMVVQLHIEEHKEFVKKLKKNNKHDICASCFFYADIMSFFSNHILKKDNTLFHKIQ